MCWDDVVVLFSRTFVICNVGFCFKVGGRGRGFFLVFQIHECVSNISDGLIVLFIRTLSFVI